MKVMHLLQSPHFSGAENVACQIIGIINDDSDIESVYCSADGPIREALAERDIRFVPLKKFCLREVKRAIKREKPDVIHAHDMKASLFAALLRKNAILISHIHNNAFNSRGFSVKSIAYMYAATKAKHIFWVSKSSFDGYAFHRLFGKKSTILYNIIDVDALYDKMNLDKNEYAYDGIFIGRLTFQKNPQRLMRVCQLVVQKMPQFKMAVVGTGELENEMKTCAQEYGIVDNVSFLGYQSNPLKMLRDSKALILTSRWEGTPMCVLEAMALGVPVVSTPVDGLNDLIVDGENGRLADEDEALATYICEIVNDKDLRERMGTFSKKIITQTQNKQDYKARIISKYR